MDLALNTLQRLICHKTQTTNQIKIRSVCCNFCLCILYFCIRASFKFRGNLQTILVNLLRKKLKDQTPKKVFKSFPSKNILKINIILNHQLLNRWLEFKPWTKLFLSFCAKTLGKGKYPFVLSIYGSVHINLRGLFTDKAILVEWQQ